MRWGERLEYFADAGPSDFKYVPHQEINASRDEPLSCVILRGGQEPVVVNLEIAPAEPPEEVDWMGCTELPQAAREDLLRDLAGWPLALQEARRAQSRA